MKDPAAPISFAGSVLGDTRHICAFFHSDEEEYQVLLPFIKSGFECGDKAVHIVNPHQREDHLRRLAAAGIDVAAAQKTGQLDLLINNEAYLRDGRFNQDRMIASFEEIACDNVKREYPINRIVCRMDWAADGSRVNDVWTRSHDAVICTYHLPKFGGDTVIDILRTHPMVIIGGILQQNPFFVRPADFLSERRERRARRTAPPTTAA